MEEKKTSGEGQGEGGVEKEKRGRKKNWVVRKGCEEGRERGRGKVRKR